MSSMADKSKEITIEKSGRVRVRTINTDKGLTQQHFKDQCDVNKIIEKYKKTGEFTHLTRKGGVYADVSHITDYATSLQKVLDANAAFRTLPSDVRLRFHNNPAELLEFMQNPGNVDEGIKLGLFEKMGPPPSPNANNDDLNDDKGNKGKEVKSPSEKAPKKNSPE